MLLLLFRSGHHRRFSAVGFNLVAEHPARARNAAPAQRLQAGLLLVIRIAFIFIFFSLSYSKLISYILPVAPALALLLGFNLPCITSVQWRRHLIGQAALIALGCIGALYLIRFGNHTRTPNTLY